MEQQASNKEKGIEFRQNQCKQKCYIHTKKWTDPDCLNKCLDKYSSEVFKPYSQVSEKVATPDLQYGFPPSFPPILEPFYSQEPTLSEKLEASENNFYDESTKLSLMADTLDAMFF